MGNSDRKYDLRGNGEEKKQSSASSELLNHTAL